jgi:hypothetical protein
VLFIILADTVLTWSLAHCADPCQTNLDNYFPSIYWDIHELTLYVKSRARFQFDICTEQIPNSPVLKLFVNGDRPSAEPMMAYRSYTAPLLR